jgi:hypothetical protein
MFGEIIIELVAGEDFDPVIIFGITTGHVTGQLAGRTVYAPASSPSLKRSNQFKPESMIARRRTRMRELGLTNMMSYIH